MKNTESNNTILARKLGKLVMCFYKNPDPYISNFKLIRSDSEDFDYIACSRRDSAFVICAGDYWNDGLQERWIQEKTDIISFSPNCTHQNGKSVCITYDFNNDYVLDFTDMSIYTESYLFQQSLVLPFYAYNSLELYLELKRFCTVPFKVNLEYIDIDAGLKFYETI